MNVTTRLAAFAPDLARSSERTASIREQVLARATAVDLASRRRRDRTRRCRLLLGSAVAVLAAGALVIGPGLIPDEAPLSANALTPLAQAAERTEVSPLSGGRVLHRITEYRRTDTRTGQVSIRQDNEWTRADGSSYRQTTVDGTVGPTEHRSTISSDDFTPQEIAALPTNPADLLKALRQSSQVTTSAGSDRPAEAFALDTIIYGGYAPTKIWSAAIQAFGSFDDVRVHVDEGKNLTLVTEVVKGGPLTMRFDSTTGQLLGYDSTSPEDGGSTETMRVRLSEVAQAVPSRIR